MGTELPHGKPDLHEILMTYHNFGICAQVDVTGLKEGLSRVKAVIQVQDYINGPLHNLESEFSEVAVYNKLTIVGPSYKPYLSDLYSKSQLGQEF